MLESTFDVLNPKGYGRVVVLAEHAGREFPIGYDNLGLDQAELGRERNLSL
jgi:predicted N-formylglutamate amidohydrolase